MILYYKEESLVKCQTGWIGKNCDTCAQNFGPAGQCDQCLRGWNGENCSQCAANFGPPGHCDQCLRGWAGENCDVCEFGFSTESNCTECIQNGTWAGPYSPFHMTVYLTFEGPACTNLVPGMYSMH